MVRAVDLEASKTAVRLGPRFKSCVGLRYYILTNRLTIISNQIEYDWLNKTFNDVRRKPYMVEIHSTVEKGAKRMPDPTVETTRGQLFKNLSNI